MINKWIECTNIKSGHPNSNYGYISTCAIAGKLYIENIRRPFLNQASFTVYKIFYLFSIFYSKLY